MIKQKLNLLQLDKTIQTQSLEELYSRKAELIKFEEELIHKEKLITLREKFLDIRIKRAKIKAAGSSRTASKLRASYELLQKNNLIAQKIKNESEAETILTQTQLRETNERLVVTSLHAQIMSEAAQTASEKLAHMAKHDYLTGLPNRSLLADRLSQAIPLALRHHKKVAIMYLDIDNFKHINDSLGHGVGDKLLQSLAKRLLTCIRFSDTVSRHGGDEFVILLSEVNDAADAIFIAEKLIDAMAEPHVIEGNPLNVTISIGISLCPENGINSEILMRNADTAMYHAKKKGRNTYQVFNGEMNALAVMRQSVEQALYLAIERLELVIYYQPKINLQTFDLTGVEALLRWQKSGNHLVMPVDFITIAEESGLILPIGNWVLRQACTQAKVWIAAGIDIKQIAVNISAKEFHHKNFFNSVHTILLETGLEPHRLEIELTESGLMQDTEPTMAILYGLKELGVRIAVDDFGTGYSSLSYLQRFPIDTLKIDQSFVQDIDSDAGIAIVNAIVAMGQGLKLQVVAEGIETSHQLEVLVNTCNCPEGQGFLFSKPVTAKDFSKQFASGKIHVKTLD